MIYIYAIVDGRAAVESPLRRLAYGDVAAVYREVESLPAVTEESLRHQESVLERLMEEREVLPLRFGSAVADEDELRRLLATRHDEFAVSLARVRGRVEMGIRASAPAKPSSTGREYVEARLGWRRAAESVHAELASLAHDSSLHVATHAGLTFSGAYLVDRARVADFQRAAGAVRPDLDLACSGPWPPFSFADAEGAS